MARKKAQRVDGEEGALEAPQSPEEVEAATVAPAESEASEEAAPAPVELPAQPVEKYEVVSTIRLSYKGQFLSLTKGDVIEPASYGPHFASVLKDVGVELKKVAG